MSKLPHEIRVQVARNTALEVWDMSELLEVIRQEVEAREISEGVKTNVNLEKVNPKPQRTPTANALLSQDGTQTSPLKGIQVKCAYCKGGHFSASCESVTDPKARFEILKRDGRCFVCLSLDHQSTSCEKNCRRCNGNHHQSICRRQTHRKSQHDLSANKNSQETQNSTLVTQSTEVSQLPQSTTTASSGSKGTVLLQTASAIARNGDSTKSTRVKILFDNGSQRSYVTDNLKSRLGLKSMKKEMLHLSTFGAKTFRKQKCDVLTLFLQDVNEETSKVCVLSFPTTCSPLPLANYSNSEDSIDVLIGSDYYWDFVTSAIVRGDFGPTAFNTKFGWLLSDPTESIINQETTVANLTTAGKSNSLFDYTQDALVDTLKQFWETESIGIKEVSEMVVGKMEVRGKLLYIWLIYALF